MTNFRSSRLHLSHTQYPAVLEVTVQQLMGPKSRCALGSAPGMSSRAEYASLPEYLDLQLPALVSALVSRLPCFPPSGRRGHSPQLRLLHHTGRVPLATHGSTSEVVGITGTHSQAFLGAILTTALSCPWGACSPYAAAHGVEEESPHPSHFPKPAACACSLTSSHPTRVCSEEHLWPCSANQADKSGSELSLV